MLIVLADCIGYYSNKDIKVNENFLNDNWSWTGCGAGKHENLIFCIMEILLLVLLLEIKH